MNKRFSVWRLFIGGLALMLASCSGLGTTPPIHTQPAYPPPSVEGASPPAAANPGAYPAPPSLKPAPGDAGMQNWMPQPGDNQLLRGKVEVKKAQIIAMTSYPAQMVLSLAGTLPTPCHQLRVQVASPDAQNRILVDVYSLYQPSKICVQVLENFQANVPLQGLAAGKYTVWVNGSQIGEFSQ